LEIAMSCLLQSTVAPVTMLWQTIIVASRGFSAMPGDTNALRQASFCHTGMWQ
jgi:hypothetical protein